MWTTGRKLDLLHEIKEEVRKQRLKRRGRKPAATEDERLPLPRGTQRAVLRAVREGALSKATKILLAYDCDMLGPETDETLRELHPSVEPPLIPAAQPPEIEDLTAEDVIKALKSFPPRLRCRSFGSDGSPHPPGS
jgi:hypothetical protein